MTEGVKGALKRDATSALARQSRPARGSSSSSSPGLRARATARATRLCWPPDRVDSGCCTGMSSSPVDFRMGDSSCAAACLASRFARGHANVISYSRHADAPSAIGVLGNSLAVRCCAVVIQSAHMVVFLCASSDRADKKLTGHV